MYEAATQKNGLKKAPFLKKHPVIGELWLKREYIFMMIPFFVLFTFFTIVPVLMSLPISLTNFNMLQFPKFVGWANFQRLFLKDDIFLTVVKNTLAFAFLTGPLSYFLCFFLAWIINEFKPRVRAVLTFIFYAPSISGNIFMIWSFLFSGDAYGFVNGTLMKIGLIDDPVQWLVDPRYNLKVVILVQLWISLGTSFLAFIAGFQNVDTSLYESGAIDGVRNRWQELWYITVPSMTPQLMFGAVMQISASFSAGMVSMALAGFPSTDYSADTVMTYALDYGSIRYEMGYASAICFVLFSAMLVTNSIIQNVFRKVSD